MKNQQNHSPDYELAARYLAGEADPDEAIMLDDWRNESDENNHMMENISKLWLVAGQYQQPDMDAEWMRLQGSMQRRSILKTLLSVAAAVIVIATGIWIALQQPASVEIKPQFVASIADTGVKKLQLPDSSRVTLNTGSTLISPKQFENGLRSVTLKGEAYFEITPNTDQPFMISVDEVRIKVIGTSFNINATDSNIQVSVRSGTVMMLTDTDSIVINKDQSGIYDRKTAQLRLMEGIDINAMAYATNYFVFDNIKLGEAMTSLEHAFKMDIIFTNPSLANCRIVGQFDHVTIDQILKTIAVTFNAELKKEGRTAYFSGDGCD